MPTHIELDLLLGKNRPRGVPQPREEGRRLRVLVLGDLSGRAADALSPWRDGALQAVDIDNFNAVLARLVPALTLTLPGQSEPVASLSLRSMEDFEPDALVAHLPLFARLRDLRRRLGDAATFEQAAAELRAVQPVGAAAAPAPAPAAASAPAEDDRATLERLLGGSLPPAAPTAAAGNLPGRLDRLLKDLVAPHVVPATSHLQQPLIESVDRTMGATLRALLRHPQWRAVEAVWRGLDTLLRQVDGQSTRVELLDVRADEVLADIAAAGGDLSATGLARLLAKRAERDGAELQVDVVAALYEFGPSAPELALLAGLGALAAHAQGVLLAAAAPPLAGFASAAAPGDPAQWQLTAPQQAAWSALRGSWVARHIGLVLPRVLGRLPYGPKGQPVSALGFDELADGFEHERLAWRLAVPDLVALLAQGHAQDGFALEVDEHLDVEDLPAWVDRSGGEARLQAGAECYLSDRQASALAAQGLMPLVSDRSLPRARLAGWRSVAANGAPLAGAWSD